MAIAIDDEDSQRLLRLFNTPEGQKYMKDELGMSDEEVQKMTWLGISGIANVLCCIKLAKYYELTENDVVDGRKTNKLEVGALMTRVEGGKADE